LFHHTLPVSKNTPCKNAAFNFGEALIANDPFRMLILYKLNMHAKLIFAISHSNVFYERIPTRAARYYTVVNAIFPFSRVNSYSGNEV